MFSPNILNIRQNDENFLKNFISDAEGNYKVKVNKNTNVSNIKTAIVKICYLNKKLSELNKELKNNVSCDNWNDSVNFCENYKTDIKMLMKVIESNMVQSVKKHVLKQESKLKRRKQRNKELILKKEQANKAKNHLIANIDNWIKSKQNEIDDEKERQILRKNADIVLSDVRANRIESKKYLTILKELKNLRKVKVTIARERGEVIALESDKVFENIIVKLTEQWASLDREYFLEEKGLNLMIKTGNEQKKLKQKKNLFEEWEVVLFNKNLSANQQNQNSDTFVTLRMLWDKYIDEEGSAVPIGWIVPTQSTCDAWSKYLCENTNCTK